MNILESLKQRLANDTEFGQAVIRLPVGAICAAYYHWTVATELTDPGSMRMWMVGATYLFFLFSIAILLHVIRYPGNYWSRRLLAMLLDFTVCGMILSVGGEANLPAFGALLWTTVGYGIRYGGSYLIVSTLVGQITIALVIATSSYWQEQVYQSAAFVLTLLIGPGYAFALISRLQRAHDDAQEESRRKSRFVAQVSHDVRQPIHAIGLLTARLGDSQLSADQAALVAKIDRSVLSAVQQLQTFLNITTIEAGLIQPKLEPVSLDRLLKDQAAQHLALALSLGASVHAVSTTATVLTDRVFLTTILQNLISNSIKYAPTSNILLGCRRDGGKLAICVYDSGPGIDAEDLPLVTGRYFRRPDKGARPAEGTGLGLSIVKQLADSLGLEVKIISRKHKGTAIWITGLEATGRQENALPERNANAFSQLHGLRISVVEDDPAALEATRDLLSRWGCEVACYTLPTSEAADSDIIVSDFDFGDGTTVIDFQQLWNESKPLIVVSGHAREQVSQALGDRIVTILEKPLRAGELRSALMAAKLVIAHRTVAAEP
jgi:signal transduction histidine kinase/CheY-like chemotaxis protein